MGKNIKATLYMESKVKHSRKDGLYLVSDPSGYLYSDGRYRTKILPEDLPEWFIHVYIYKQYGYISAKGIKHLVYKPNYFFDNHLHKDDFLYISYNDEIVRDASEDQYDWYRGYDHLVYGVTILFFLDAVEKYSDYDTSEIRKEIERKTEWYYERNPKKRGA
jgi:hypothetical protein